MPIDVKEPLSAGWWMARLSRKLYDTRRLNRLERLDARWRGEPPLPQGAGAWKPAFSAFQRQSRLNLASLLVESCRNRMTPRGVRTSADGDATGDAEAWRIWTRAYMSLVEPEVHRLMLRFGESFALTSPVDPDTGVPVVTAEDPRSVVSEQDPLQPWKTVAGLKVYRDHIAGEDVALLYRPGRLDAAVQPFKRGEGIAEAADPGRFSDRWEWSVSRSRSLPPGLMPLVRFENHEGVAEFERHTDLLDRINAEILRQMVITQLQAFRQRGMQGLPVADDAGEPIDWTGMFDADPGSLWAIPPDVTVWESQTVDITPILTAIRDSLRQLAAVTATTVHTLDPGGENQSAEGAANAKEAQTFKIQDRITLANPRWSQVMRNCFLWMAEDAGDEEIRQAALDRADLNGISLIWDKPDKPSLSERASAAAQAAAAGVPWRTIMIEIMDFSPDQVDRMEVERDDDLLFAQRLASVKAATTSPQQPEPADAAA
ncbi:hypothetical protein KIH74_22965 [Kineosporia sp. J2-2]|uniref:Phage portal protein n=1 Tax=Kineosporia corallincola TaxID=2835133 RepID=A0ABS5TNP4_9ACTN|nr:hypothetical protein [Kineosporia corallincola]MBT0771821.1 hypothetical protein [Kineosporia corallincola]